MSEILGQHPNYLFSTEHVPQPGTTPTDCELEWFGEDNERRVKQRPHPTLKAGNISYRFNSSGYRCSEFNDPQLNNNTLKIVSLGASEVFGCGLPEEQTFASVFSKLIEKNSQRPTLNWNLGIPGTSSDSISRVLFSVLPVLKPDIVLIIFPFASRREYINDSGRLLTFRSSSESEKNKLLKNLFDPEQAQVNKAYNSLASEYSDQINLFNNYQICQSLCENNNALWMFSSFFETCFKSIKPLLNTDHLVLPGICDLRNNCLDEKIDPALCWARDMSHPGAKPNHQMAELFYERIKQIYPERSQELGL